MSGNESQSDVQAEFWGFQTHLSALTGVEVCNFGRIRPEHVTDPTAPPIHNVNALGGIAIPDEVVRQAWDSYNS